jgi:hypothetical protein
MIILSPFTKSVSASAIVIESVSNPNLSSRFYSKIASALSLAEKLPNFVDIKSVSLKKPVTG